jgi:hypothetical protein
MIPLDLGGARRTLIDRLTAAGIKATGDPGALSPVVLVAAPTVLQAIAGGPPTINVVFTIVCLHPPPGNEAALDWLLDTASAVVDELAPCQFSTLSGTYGDPPQPSYTVTVTGELATC